MEIWETYRETFRLSDEEVRVTFNMDGKDLNIDISSSNCDHFTIGDTYAQTIIIPNIESLGCTMGVIKKDSKLYFKDFSHLDYEFSPMIKLKKKISNFNKVENCATPIREDYIIYFA